MRFYPYNGCMNRLFLIVSIGLICLIGLMSQIRQITYAQSASSSATQVKARVGEFYLTISGFISPFASIAMSIDDIVVAATASDQEANFSISNILIKRGFSRFCLLAVDFKQLGESTTCVDVPPANGNVTLKDLFLPPTLGMQRLEVSPGEPARAFGYTMPGATVTLHLSDGRIFMTTANQEGYYEFELKDLLGGDYTVYATASYDGKESLAPTKVLSFHVLSFWQWLLLILKKWLWLILLLLLVGIGYLLYRLFPGKLSFITRLPFIHSFPRKWFRREKKLHHAWMFGY